MTVTVCHSRMSSPSARTLAQALTDHGLPATASRVNHGLINWGRRTADTALNPDVSFTSNKRAMRLRFHEHGVPTPRLLTYFDASRHVREGGTVVGRPDRHSRRRHLYVIDNLDDLDAALTGRSGTRPATHFFEWVDAPYEFRVHVFNGRSIRLSRKDFTQPTNTRAYTTVSAGDLPVAHVRQAAKDAVAVVGLDFGAVDVLADESDCWVLEVNSAPGLAGTTQDVYARAIINYMTATQGQEHD